MLLLLARMRESGTDIYIEREKDSCFVREKGKQKRIKRKGSLLNAFGYLPNALLRSQKPTKLLRIHSAFIYSTPSFLFSYISLFSSKINVQMIIMK